MIHITVGDRGESVGFEVEFDGPEDAEATMRGEQVRVAITPAMEINPDTRAFLSRLIGSAAEQYVARKAH